MSYIAHGERERPGLESGNSAAENAALAENAAPADCHSDKCQGRRCAVLTSLHPRSQDSLRIWVFSGLLQAFLSRALLSQSLLPRLCVQMR